MIAQLFTHSKRLLMTMITLVISLAGTPGNGSTASVVAIVGATIIDGNGGDPIRQGVLVIEDSRILTVGAKGTPIPAQARVIEAQGKTIIPGLMDANVHLFGWGGVEKFAKFEGRYDELIAEAAQQALKNGVTTVFDSWGPREPLVKVRDAIQAGTTEGSRIFLAGNIVGYGGPLSVDFGFSPVVKQYTSQVLVNGVNAMWEQGVGPELLWMTPDKIGEKVRHYVTKEIDFVKYAASGHASDQMQLIAFSAEAQDSIVAEARQAGLTVQTHTSSVASLDMAISAGVDILQHCELSGPVLIPKAIMQRIVENNIACAVLPNTNKRLQWIKDTPMDQQFKDVLLTMDKNLRSMVAAGVTLLLSTDASIFGEDTLTMPAVAGGLHGSKDSLSTLGEGHFHWLKAMSEKGMAPMDVLMAATRHVAEAYEVDAELGTLEKGKLADLLILNSDPLKDPENYRDIHLIIKNGQVVDRSSLPRQAILTAN